MVERVNFFLGSIGEYINVVFEVYVDFVVYIVGRCDGEETRVGGMNLFFGIFRLGSFCFF